MLRTARWGSGAFLHACMHGYRSAILYLDQVKTERVEKYGANQNLRLQTACYTYALLNIVAVLANFARLGV